ncbi:unnamed protein product [Cyprideis torosa]|uniref:Uncharacterized protein n=1 Tax=Cyprideis torosa TaxID=163714 RepID=A0A7R8ZVE7_9CRUS|nr:unnamed protein product [Cyprideis torosa]CAG0903051.1 unnamed protein product [Cyprideis torosa]
MAQATLEQQDSTPIVFVLEDFTPDMLDNLIFQETQLKSNEGYTFLTLSRPLFFYTKNPTNHFFFIFENKNKRPFVGITNWTAEQQQKLEELDRKLLDRFLTTCGNQNVTSKAMLHKNWMDARMRGNTIQPVNLEFRFGGEKQCVRNMDDLCQELNTSRRNCQIGISVKDAWINPTGDAIHCRPYVEVIQLFYRKKDETLAEEIKDGFDRRRGALSTLWVEHLMEGWMLEEPQRGAESN